jgi:hypothetical protein
MNMMFAGPSPPPPSAPHNRKKFSLLPQTTNPNFSNVNKSHTWITPV